MRKINMINKWKRICALLICLVFVCLIITPTSSFAEENQAKVVRIGWYQSDYFQEGMSDDVYKSGYSYEYIHHVADYNGWSYEYVYGEWTELFSMLKSGEIDILAGVSKTEERMNYLLYPNEIMGNEHYAIFQHRDNHVLDAANLSTFKGKKIGAISDNLMTSYLEDWLEANGAEAEIVYYNGFEERDRDFSEGKLDAIVATDNNIISVDGYDQVIRVGKEAYYLAVTKGRSDLLEDLNRAQDFIQDIDPYYLNNLEYQSYGTTLMNGTLTTKEEEWVKQHDTLTVGYLENYITYSGTDDDGNAYGLITDVMSAMLKELNIDDRISVRYKAFVSGDDMIEALNDGDIDAAFPVGGELWQLEQYGIKASNDLVTSNVNLVCKGNYSRDNIKHLAVTKGNTMMRDYLTAEFPDAEFKEFASITDCMDAVLNNQADATTINSLRVDLVKKNRNYDALTLVRMSKTSGRCIGVAAGNTGLLMLINRGVKLIGSDFASNASYNYMSDLYRVTVPDFIAGHLGLAVGIVALIILIIIFAALRIQNKTKEFLRIEEIKNRELRDNQLKLEEATSEQEAQIEEITTLNIELQELKKIADAANLSKTNFLNNMSHDIRTPMNAIIGYTALMEKNKDDPGIISDYIEKMKISSEYLLSILNNILDMARIESGKMVADESVMDLLDAERKIVATFSESTKKKNQTFAVRNTIKHRYILCDVAKQQEIMMNLLSNAMKYTPEGGIIQMTMDELPCEKSGYGIYRLTVSDNGIGMSEEFQKELFESFTREKNTTESKIIGTGLGMAIVKRLVDFLGGTITVESEQGKGSAFIVTMEHQIVENPDHDLTSILESTKCEDILRGKRVLLAEDNDLNAEIAISVLEDLGLETDRAADGEECLERLQKMESQYYDLILMDIQMPKLNGYDTAKRIRALQDQEKAGIPIIAMTANAFEEDKQHALAAGMNGHLAKPIDIQKLKEMLIAVMMKGVNSDGKLHGIEK